MISRGRLDRAAMVLGGVSIISAAFVFVHGTYQIVQIRGAGLVVALVLGLLAVVAGWFNEPTLISPRAPGSCSRLPSSLACWPRRCRPFRRERFDVFVVAGTGCRADRDWHGGTATEPAEETSYGN